MFQTLVSHNPDLQRLLDKGYALAFDEANYLVVRDIPYLNAAGDLLWGAFVTKIVLIDEVRIQQEDHQVFFAGSIPHELNGSPIANLAGGPRGLALSEDSADVVVERSFSNKPKDTGRFADFFEKIERYVAIISGPAMEKHGVHPYTRRMVVSRAEPSVFKFRDTMTSRAEIVDLAARFKDDVIAVIGLGGTGSYLLDFLVKTPVREIRAFDADPFHVHNAFRSPGRLDPQDFGKPKAVVYGDRYENFRHGLSVEPKYLDASSEEDLAGVTFAFVCVDKGSSRAALFDLLIRKGIPFIDVGMGLKRKGGGLSGMVRATFVEAGDPHNLRTSGLVEMTDNADDLYRTNIQIGELNALNATLAVIRFKQLRGYYVEETPYYHMLMGLGDLKVIGEATDDAA
jgi:hypothetical protein